MKTQEKELKDLVAEIQAAGRGKRLKLLPELLLRVSQFEPGQQLRFLTEVLGGPQAARFLDLYQKSQPLRKADSKNEETGWIEKLESLLSSALEGPDQPRKSATETKTDPAGLKTKKRQPSTGRPAGKSPQRQSRAVDLRELNRPKTKTKPPPPLSAPSSPPVKVESRTSKPEPQAQGDRQHSEPQKAVKSTAKPSASEVDREASFDDPVLPPPLKDTRPLDSVSFPGSQSTSDRPRKEGKPDPGMLVDKLLKIDSPFGRYRFYCRQLDRLELDPQTALDLIDALPSLWMRRRALGRLLDDKFFQDAEAAVAAVHHLASSGSQFIWLTRRLVSNYQLSEEQKAALITSSPSDTIGRLLKRFLDD